jgi:glycosyltransferase involved in cell wall biosynthesis
MRFREGFGPRHFPRANDLCPGRSPHRRVEKQLMRVCLVPNGRTWAHQGGHRTQQLRTAVALGRAGASVVLGGAQLASSLPFDIVHYFGDPTELVELSRPKGRLVVSPVYFPASVQLGVVERRVGWGSQSWNRFRHALTCTRHPAIRSQQWRDLRASLRALAVADLIVVNSRAEGRLLVDDFRRYEPSQKMPPFAVAYSGVDGVFFEGSPERGRKLVGEEPYVLCVGRPEARKNQLLLCHAMRGVPRRLVLIGQVLPGNERLMEACRHALPSVVHLPHLEPAALADVYAAADVHVLASHYETTGLSTLEAMAAGTPVVVGRGPCVEEYFGGCGSFVDPKNVREIREAIVAALGRPRGCERRMARSYSWERTADELLRAYERA